MVRTIRQPLTRTFQETVYHTVSSGFLDIELEIQVSGTLDTKEPGYNPIPDILGIEVLSATRLADGEQYPPHLLDWIDSEVNRRYWWGELSEALEESLTEQLTQAIGE